MAFTCCALFNFACAAPRGLLDARGRTALLELDALFDSGVTISASPLSSDTRRPLRGFALDALGFCLLFEERGAYPNPATSCSNF
jgi:hypothetical protein